MNTIKKRVKQDYSNSSNSRHLLKFLEGKYSKPIKIIICFHNYFRPFHSRTQSTKLIDNDVRKKKILAK